MRVLVAEDNPTNQQVAQLLLRRLGFEADEAADGRTAVEAAREHDYDVVLMDVQMPGLDGLEATRVIRAELPPERQPYIIGLTAGAFTEDRNACLDAGMDDFLTKPVRQAELAEALRRRQARLDRSPAEPGPSPAGPRIDPEITARFEADFGPDAPQVLTTLIDTFLEQAPQSIEDLVGAARRHDADAVRQAAHRLRSGSAVIGATTMATMLADLEERARSQPDADLVPLADEVRSEWEPLAEELHGLRAT